jgi:hypothetical protein
MSGLFSKPDTSAQDRALEEQRKQNEADKLRIEGERRDASELAAGKLRARQRGGARALLAATRLNPETGVDTLGTTTTVG